MLRNERGKMKAIRPVHFSLLKPSHIRFADKRGSLKRVVATLPCKLELGCDPQFVVDDRSSWTSEFLWPD